MVFQSEALLAGTVYENISFLRELPREEVEAAARTAQAWEFIEKLPQGLDTQVDIRGANLSGGQRQRLLIARALAGAALHFDSGQRGQRPGLPHGGTAPQRSAAGLSGDDHRGDLGAGVVLAGG